MGHHRLSLHSSMFKGVKWRQCWFEKLLIVNLANYSLWSWPGLGWTREQLFTVDVVPAALWLQLNFSWLEETLISPTQSWHDTSATVPQSTLPSPPTENTWKIQSRQWKCILFIDYPHFNRREGFKLWSRFPAQRLLVSDVKYLSSFIFSVRSRWAVGVD